MSNINLQWLQENCQQDNLVIFNIGCADITDDSFRFQIAFPNATVYSFECSNVWKESNLEKSKWFDLPYIHTAVSNTDGVRLFTECHQTETHQEYSGTLAPECCINERKKWGSNYLVPTTTLNSFCDNYDLIPHILHIDAEHEEYNILKNLKILYQPMIIWIEYNHVYNDNFNKNLISFDKVNQMIENQGYVQFYHDKLDVLYVKQGLEFTAYQSYRHHAANDVEISSHEKQIQSAIWLKRYQLCKDLAWPHLHCPKDFFSLPEFIRQECKTKFNLLPDQRIL